MLYDTRPVFYADNRQQIRELVNETTNFYRVLAFSPLFRKSRRAAPIRLRSKTEHARELVPLNAPSLWRRIADERSVKVSPLYFVSAQSRERNFCEKDENAVRSGNAPVPAAACFLVNCEAKVNRETAIRRRFIRNFGIRD